MTIEKNVGTVKPKKPKYDYTAFLWIAPALIMMFIFCYYPPVYAAILSFTDSTGGDTFKFIGLANYIEILTDKLSG